MRILVPVRTVEASSEDDKWWFALSHTAKKKYVEEHPGSRFAKGWHLPSGKLYDLAESDPNVVYHPDVTKVQGIIRTTPLHNAARRFRQVLHHPDVGKVQDTFGQTPLHIAATQYAEAFKHPDMDRIRDNRGNTPRQHAESMAGEKQTDTKLFKKMSHGDKEKYLTVHPFSKNGPGFGRKWAEHVKIHSPQYHQAHADRHRQKSSEYKKAAEEFLKTAQTSVKDSKVPPLSGDVERLLKLEKNHERWEQLHRRLLRPIKNELTQKRLVHNDDVPHGVDYHSVYKQEGQTLRTLKVTGGAPTDSWPGYDAGAQAVPKIVTDKEEEDLVDTSPQSTQKPRACNPLFWDLDYKGSGQEAEPKDEDD